MAEHNLLFNGNLDQNFESFRSDIKLQTPAGWGPWWLLPSKNAPTWQNQPPTFDGYMVEGQKTLRVSSPYATHTGGVYQQVPAVVGGQYELSVEAMAWSSEAEEDGQLQNASDVQLTVGVDPTGGLDGDSPVIIWSKPITALGKWGTVRLSFMAQANIMTVFLRSAPQLPKRQQMVFWRNGLLRPTGPYKRSTNIVGPGDTHLQLEPERPQPGQRLKATASAQRSHRNVELRVRRPDGELTAVVFQGGRQEDDRYFWGYEFAIDEEGLYDIRFLADNGSKLLAQRLVRSAREVQIVPSGRARLDYKRVYVLLPPTADVAWLVAAAKGSFIGRYTIGFSVDDGAIGDVAERVVIGVNPHHWPETLTTTWYLHHYPGTRFIPVVANAPEDLEAWLSEWVDE